MNAASTLARQIKSTRHQRVDEAIGLFGYLASGSRRLLQFSVLAALAGLGILYACTFYFEPRAMRTAMAVVVAVTQLPLLLISVALFDFASSRLDSRGSMLDGFIKRSPVPTWLIAVVAWSSKTLGISVWMAVFIASTAMASRPLSALMASQLFAALLGIAFWFSVVIWRPFRSEIGRAVTGLLVLVFGYGAIVSAVTTDIDFMNRWCRIGEVVWPPWIAMISGLLVGWRSIRASRAELATKSDHLKIHRNPASRSSGVARLEVTRLLSRFPGFRPERHSLDSTGTVRELLSYDRRRIAGFTFWISVFLAPFLLFTLIDAPLVGTLMSVCFGHFIACNATGGGWGDVRSGRLVGGKRKTLNLIAVSPVPLTELCRIKILRCVFLGFGIAISFGVACVAATYLSDHADRWRSWAFSLSPIAETFPTTGLRVCVTAWLLVIVSIVGMTVGNVWIQFFARDRWVTVVTLLVSIALGIGLGVGLYHLITMRSYEDMIAFRDRLYQCVPWLLVGLVALKAGLFPIALRSAVRRKAFDRHQWIIQVLAAWIACVLIVWLLLLGLWPRLHEPENSALVWLYQPTNLQFLQVSILLIPCSRVLTMPWALATDLHR